MDFFSYCFFWLFFYGSWIATLAQPIPTWPLSHTRSFLSPCFASLPLRSLSSTARSIVAQLRLLLSQTNTLPAGTCPHSLHSLLGDATIFFPFQEASDRLQYLQDEITLLENHEKMLDQHKMVMEYTVAQFIKYISDGRTTYL